MIKVTTMGPSALLNDFMIGTVILDKLTCLKFNEGTSSLIFTHALEKLQRGVQTACIPQYNNKDYSLHSNYHQKEHNTKLRYLSVPTTFLDT